MGFETVTRTHVGCRRKINEDSLLALPERGLWAVADGMGGHDAGEVASALVIEELSQLAAVDPAGGTVDAAHRRLQSANARLAALAAAKGEGRTIGSTVVAFLAVRNRYSCLWAGDSRAYRLRGAGLVQLTRDHSLVQELVDLGEITAADARTHPNANVITRAVGTGAGLQIDQVDGDVDAGDLFLLASDGLTRLVSDEELALALRSPDLATAADDLVQTCLRRGAPDNLSLVIIKSDGGSWPAGPLGG